MTKSGMYRQFGPDTFANLERKIAAKQYVGPDELARVLRGTAHTAQDPRLPLRFPRAQGPGARRQAGGYRETAATDQKAPHPTNLRALSRLAETAKAVDGDRGLENDPGGRLVGGTAERAGGANDLPPPGARDGLAQGSEHRQRSEQIMLGQPAARETFTGIAAALS